MLLSLPRLNLSSPIAAPTSQHIYFHPSPSRLLWPLRAGGSDEAWWCTGACHKSRPPCSSFIAFHTQVIHWSNAKRFVSLTNINSDRSVGRLNFEIISCILQPGSMLLNTMDTNGTVSSKQSSGGDPVWLTGR